MVNQAIKIYARIKPSSKSKTAIYNVENEKECSEINFILPREVLSGYVNNKKENYKFKFDHVFDQKTDQDEIFDLICKPVIDNVLEGYNGTIFAYGQTGSGKTYTITGGAERYIERGIIPRSISYLFQQIRKQSEYEYTMHISYLEIYNENGYDLLDPKQNASKLEDLPKVTLREDSDQNIHLLNLTIHQTGTEEDALNLLFLGDTNRMIAETPMNQASTRSHCIFTIHLTSRISGSATIRRAKLHLVDLAGSERVGKTGTSGILLTEAKYINLSLHFLEQVIITLSDKNRSHIPYRNSMMTSVLRDSLGGNCMTTMIATLSAEKNNIEESISTCRFAQRVALISNEAILNEELDPRILIERLKQEICQLKDEISLLTGEQRTDELTDEEKLRCQTAVCEYVSSESSESKLNVGSDMRKIHLCYWLMKKMSKSQTQNEPIKDEKAAMGPYCNSELGQLKQLLEQRDNEINILVDMLKKEKQNSTEASQILDKNSAIEVCSKSVSDMSQVSQKISSTKTDIFDSSRFNVDFSTITRKEGFDIFRKDYAHNAAIEDNKVLLKQKINEAKRLGEEMNALKNSINRIKSQIENHRMLLVMRGLVNDSMKEADDVEMNLRQQLDEEKIKYKENYTTLKTVKTETDHIQHLIEKSRVKLMKDFELWWAQQITEQDYNNKPQNVHSGQRSAWTNIQDTADKNKPKRDEISRSSSRQSSSHQSRKSSADFENSISSLNSFPDSNSHQLKSHGEIPLTGDSRVDADILAFVKARQKLLFRNGINS